MKSVFVLTFLLTSSIASGVADEWGQPYWFYGLFSTTSCRSRFDFSCLNAAKSERTMREMIRRNEKQLGVRMPFCTRDVGDNPDRLLESLFPLIEQPSINFTGLCNDPDIRGYHSVKGVIVLTFAVFELTQLASAMLLPFDIPLFAVTFQPMYPAVFTDHPLFVYSYGASFQIDLHRNGINALRKDLNISVVAVLNLQQEDASGVATTNTTKLKHAGDTRCDREDTSAFCVYYENGLKDGCIKEKTINMRQLESALASILEQPRLSFVILHGSNNALGEFYSQLGKFNATLTKRLKAIYFLNFEVLDLAHDSKVYNQSRDPKLRSANDYYVFHDVPGAWAMNKLMYFTHDFQENFLQIDFIKRVWQRIEPAQIVELLGSDFPNLAMIKLTPELWNVLEKEQKMKFFDTLKYNTQVIGAQISAWKETFYVNLVKTKELFEHDEFNPDAALKAKPYCNLTIPLCGPGKELRHSFYRERGWDTSYGWHCELCEADHYKSTRNNTDCQPCGFGMKSDASRGYCYDPYTEIYLSFSGSQATAIHAILSSIMLVIITFTLIVFWRYRDTPLVRSSNKQISFLQIIVHAILTISMLPLFVGEPSRGTCVTRPLAIGMLFTLTSAINFGKTQKVLLIFKAKMRMSRKEITLAKVSMLLTILFAVLLDGLVLTGSMIFDESPEVMFAYYDDTMLKEVYCTNNEDVLIQFGVTFAIVFCNAIQGVRARNVPSHYRESTYVMYSSFTSSVVLVGATAIYMTQVSEHAKTVTLFYTVLLLNVVHFNLMYTYKIWVMLFRPEQNTREAFNEKRKARFHRSMRSDEGGPTIQLKSIKDT